LARKITDFEQLLDQIDKAANAGEQISLGAIAKDDRQQIVRSVTALGRYRPGFTAKWNPWDGDEHGGLTTADRRPDALPKRILLVASLAAGALDRAHQIL
jgi:hypothetical protein